MDCIEGLKQIPDKSVNMYFVDLPYGVTTKNKWDNIIPPEPMWEQIERTLKDNGVILFFGQDKFTAKMMLSNEKCTSTISFGRKLRLRVISMQRKCL